MRGEVRWFEVHELDRIGLIPSDMAILREIFSNRKQVVAKRIVMASDHRGRLRLESFEDIGPSH